MLKVADFLSNKTKPNNGVQMLPLVLDGGILWRINSSSTQFLICDLCLHVCVLFWICVYVIPDL